MKQEVTRLQDMLNRLDFKRKVGASRHRVQKEVTKLLGELTHLFFTPASGNPVKNGRRCQGDRRPDDVSAQPRATGLEEAAADRRHRRSAAHRPGTAAELVFRASADVGGAIFSQPAANVCLLLLRFTATAQSLFQIKRQLDKLGELIMKVTYECDPIPLQKPQLDERVKFLLYHLIKRYGRKPCPRTFLKRIQMPPCPRGTPTHHTGQIGQIYTQFQGCDRSYRHIHENVKRRGLSSARLWWRRSRACPRIHRNPS